MEECPPLHLSVVAIEIGAFGSPLTKVTNLPFFTYLANGLGDLGSIPCRVLSKTQKIVLDAVLLIMYGSRVKWIN